MNASDQAKETLTDLAMRFGPKLVVAGELNPATVGYLRRQGLEIPYPQLEVRLLGGH